jgi:hypothetical protein
MVGIALFTKRLTDSLVLNLDGMFTIIRPKNQGGTDVFENFQIVHYDTHDEIHER